MFLESHANAYGITAQEAGMQVEVKRSGSVPFDAGTVTHLLLYADHRFLMTADLYANALSLFWPMSDRGRLDAKMFASGLTTLAHAAQQTSHVDETAADCVVFVRRAEGGEVDKIEFRVNLSSLQDSIKAKVGMQMERKLVTFVAVRASGYRAWGRDRQRRRAGADGWHRALSRSHQPGRRILPRSHLVRPAHAR